MKAILAPGAILALLTACSTPMVSLESSPSGAEIHVRQFNSRDSRQIGQTPLSLSAAELKQLETAGPLVVELRKEGYLPYQAVVTDLTASDFALRGELTAITGMDDQAKLNKAVDQLFEAQALARAGRHEDALAKLREVEKIAPQIAAVYELEGGILYLQKKYREALDAYTLAAKLNPTNGQAVRMRNLIQASLDGERAPAAAGKGTP